MHGGRGRGGAATPDSSRRGQVTGRGPGGGVDSSQTLLLILQRPGFLVGVPPAVPIDPSPLHPRRPPGLAHQLIRAVGQT